MQLYPLAGITRWSRGELVEHFQQFCWECVATGYTSDDQLDDREREEVVGAFTGTWRGPRGISSAVGR